MSDLIGNPEDRFSHDAAHFRCTYFQVKDTVNNALKEGVDGYFNENSPERKFMDMVQTDVSCQLIHGPNMHVVSLVVILVFRVPIAI